MCSGQQRVGQPVLLALVRVRYRHATVLVFVVVDDVLFLVAHHDVELVGAEFDELVETVCEYRFPVHFDHPLRFVVGEWAEASPLSGREYHCVHRVRRPTPVRKGIRYLRSLRVF